MKPEALVLDTFDRLAGITRKFILDKYKSNDPKAQLPDQLNEPLILRKIFPNECEKIQEILCDTLSNLIRMKNDIISRLDKLISDYFNDQNDINDQEIPELVIVSTFSFIKRYYEELLKLLTRRSFAAAVQIQVSLFELIQRRNGNINVRLVEFESDSDSYTISSLHMAWAWLADRNFSYEKYGELNDLIKNRACIRKKFYEILKKKVRFHDVYKAWMENKREDLIELLQSCFSRRMKLNQRNTLARYFSDVIFALREALKEAVFLGDYLREEILKSYINVCMINFGFFEYEIYNLLLNEGIPALPRLKFIFRDSGEEIVWEIDILAIDSRGELTEIEITSSTNPDEILKKAADSYLGLASRRILVAPEEVIETSQVRGMGVTCVPLEKPLKLIEELAA